jgi:transcriptional regulator with XRE-family HTH domain
MGPEEVRRRREALNASPQELARAAGVLGSHVLAWEASTQPLSRTDIRVLEWGFERLELTKANEREEQRALANVRIRTPEEMAQLQLEAERTRHIRALEELPSVPAWLGVYFGSLLLGLTLAFLGERTFGIPGQRIIYGYSGAFFLAAAGGRPPILFRVLRYTGWFAGIRVTVQRGSGLALEMRRAASYGRGRAT